MNILDNKCWVVLIFLCSFFSIQTCESAENEDQLSVGSTPIPSQFNYQAEVILDGSPANGQFDVEFYLFNVEEGAGPMGGGALAFLDQSLNISDGLLNTTLDFGDGLFDFSQKWLEVVIIDSNGTGDSYILEPRAAINAVPIALIAKSVTFGSIDSGAIQSDSITAFNLANQAVSNTKLKDQDISFSKLASNGATNGDVIQYTGSAWVAAPPVGSSPWNMNSNDISYSAGNVGISTTAPAAKLHVHGDGSDELRLSGTNSTPSLHFRRNSNGADWYLKIDPSSNQFYFQSEADSVEKIMTIKPDGEITRKKQTKTTYVSYKSFIPESHVYSYSVLNFLGMTGLHSTYTGGGPAKFHADVVLPADAVITQFEVMAGDNSGSGKVVAKLGFRIFGTSNGVITLSTLTSSNSPYGEVISESLNAAVGDNRSYFIDVDIDNVTTAGQEVIFGGIRVTYETTTL